MAAERRISVAQISEPDAALLGRVARGDLGALGALHDRYASDLLRFASRSAGAQEAEDVVQTTFLRLTRLASTFRSDAPSARPWLFGIAARIVLERRRSLRRWASALLDIAARPVPHAPPLLDTRADLDRGLARMTVAKRTTLLLAEVEGFTCEEIAALLSVPIGTVWTRLYHARRELRRFYEGDDP